MFGLRFGLGFGFGLGLGLGYGIGIGLGLARLWQDEVLEARALARLVLRAHLGEIERDRGGGVRGHQPRQVLAQVALLVSVVRGGARLWRAWLG